MRKRLLAIVATAALVVAMIPAMAFAATEVNDAEGLVKALENNESVIFAKDIKIDPAELSSGYGTTGVNVKKGQTIDGNGHTLDIKGAGGTWDSGINTTGGIIKNLKVTGSFRGVFVNHNSKHSEKVILDNVVIDGTTYTISCDQGLGQGLEAKNSTFNGWTSYAADIGDVTFTSCSFGKGNGYAYIRPYAPTTFTNCEFEKGYTMDGSQTDIVLVNCYLDGKLITEDMLDKFVSGQKVKVDNYETEVKVEDVPTVDASKPVEEVVVGTNEATKEVLKETTETVVDAIIKGDDVNYVDEKVVEAIENNKTAEVSTSIVAEVIDEEDLEATFGKENIEKVENAAKDKTVSQYLDLSVIMTVKVHGAIVAEGEVSELPKAIKFTIAIPEELKAVKDGYEREFYIIRVHDGEVDLIPVTVNDDGTLSFETDRFSTYALAYEDTAKAVADNSAGKPEKSPNTGDNSMAPFAVAGLVLAAMAAVVATRRREN